MWLVTFNSYLIGRWQDHAMNKLLAVYSRYTVLIENILYYLIANASYCIMLFQESSGSCTRWIALQREVGKITGQRHTCGDSLLISIVWVSSCCNCRLLLILSELHNILLTPHSLSLILYTSLCTHNQQNKLTYWTELCRHF